MPMHRPSTGRGATVYGRPEPPPGCGQAVHGRVLAGARTLFPRFAKAVPGGGRGGDFSRAAGATLGPPRTPRADSESAPYPLLPSALALEGPVHLPVREDLESTWETVRQELRPEVTDFAFHVWIEPLRPRALRGATLYVDAPPHMRTLVGE